MFSDLIQSIKDLLRAWQRRADKARRRASIQTPFD